MCVYFILWWCYFKFYSNCTGMFYITCPLQQLSLMYDLCYPVDVWTMHLHRVREEEEGDGWKGVDDTSGVGVCTRAEKRKALTKKLNLVHAENVVYAHDHKRITKTAFLTTLLFFHSWNPRWRRETRIKEVAGRPQGEVAYYAPCGKKLRRYPDVMKVPRPYSAAV